MRLTCKTANGYCDMQIATRENKLEKLGQLEDIEEELGIDLVTLFNALKNGCCFKPWKRVYYDKHIKIEYEIDKWKLYDVFDNDYNVCDYGKTWALTKEELENNESNNSL